MDPARKGGRRAAAGPDRQDATVDELAEVAYERLRTSAAAALAAARARGAGDLAIQAAVDRAVDTGSDLAIELGLAGLQG